MRLTPPLHGKEEMPKDDERTVEDLRGRASELDIAGRSDMNKAELAAAVAEAEADERSNEVKTERAEETKASYPSVLDKILALENEIVADIYEYDDIIKAALNQVRGAISTIKDSLATHESLERPPPRERGFAPEPAAPIPGVSEPASADRASTERPEAERIPAEPEREPGQPYRTG